MAFLNRSSIRIANFIAIFMLVLSPVPQHALANGKAEKIAALAQKYHDARLFNGAILVAENGKVIFKKGYGFANFEWQIPNAPDVKYRIGSVTKQFTASIILQLMEEGKISLEGKLSDYLPDYPKATGEKVPIHQLLNHTSGIPSYTGLPNFFKDMSRDPYEPEKLIEVFSGMDFEFEPGSQFKYNNSGYFLLGAIIEKVAGKPYDKVLHERILDPLGLQNTGYDWNAPVLPKRASGYTKSFTGFENAAYLDMSLPYSAGSMYSTVEDLFKWNQILYTDKLFKNAKTKELMFTPGLSNYGYGWFIRELPIGKNGKKVNVIEHGGGINGFVTGFRRFVDDKHLIVCMDNSSQGQNDMMQGIANILYGEPADDPKLSIAEAIFETIEKNGVQTGIDQYKQLKKEHPDKYNFNEGELNRLGYHYLNNDQTETAIAIFKLNIEVYPEAANPYDSYAEALMKSGDNAGAIENYKKSLELNPGNTNAREKLKELGMEVEEKQVTVAPEVMEKYVGKYELQPGFVIAITKEDDKLMAQATGQPKFEIFPSSETEWYLKVVNAQITFNVNAEGMAESLTLHQGGRDMTGQRIE